MILSMLKLTFYFILFFIIGSNYEVITNGTIVDHFVIKIIILFLIFFMVEWMFSLVKKKRQPNQEQVEADTWKEIIEDVGKEFEKTWTIQYNDNEIFIVNKYNHEQLYINDKLVAEKRRNSLYSWFKPYQLLTGMIDGNGQSLKVKVKLGGILSLN